MSEKTWLVLAIDFSNNTHIFGEYKDLDLANHRLAIVSGAYTNLLITWVEEKEEYEKRKSVNGDLEKLIQIAKKLYEEILPDNTGSIRCFYFVNPKDGKHNMISMQLERDHYKNSGYEEKPDEY